MCAHWLKAPSSGLPPLLLTSLTRTDNKYHTQSYMWLLPSSHTPSCRKSTHGLYFLFWTFNLLILIYVKQWSKASWQDGSLKATKSILVGFGLSSGSFTKCLEIICWMNGWNTCSLSDRLLLALQVCLVYKHNHQKEQKLTACLLPLLSANLPCTRFLSTVVKT